MHTAYHARYSRVMRAVSRLVGNFIIQVFFRPNQKRHLRVPFLHLSVAGTIRTSDLRVFNLNPNSLVFLYPVVFFCSEEKSSQPQRQMPEFVKFYGYQYSIRFLGGSFLQHLNTPVLYPNLMRISFSSIISLARPRSSMDRVTDFESGGCAFDPRRGRCYLPCKSLYLKKN